MQQQEYYQLKQRASDLSQQCEQISEQLTAAQNFVSETNRIARSLVETSELRAREEILNSEENVLSLIGMMRITK
jgi:hypothetical protein